MTSTGYLSPQQREMIDRILALKGIRAAAKERAIAPLPAAESARLSFAQQRLWILDRLQPGLAAYNIPAAFELEGRLDRDALERSFAAILQRHRVLTGVFGDEAGEPVQRFGAAGARIDFTDLEGNEARATERVEEEARRPFDLARELPVRARLLRLHEERHLLLVTFHHIVADAWSVGIFVRELAALYEAHAAGRDAALPPLPIQYADFAEWQRGEALDAQLDYWGRTLAGDAPPLELPADHPRAAVQSFRGATEPFAVDPETAAALRALGQRHGATPFMVLLAAFDVLLFRYTGQRELRVGTPVAGRMRAQLEPLVGCFANTVVLRARVDPEAGFDQLLREVRESALGAFAHQDAPFEQVVERVQPERRMDRAPLFQVMFSLQNVPQQSVEVPGLVLKRVNVHNGGAKFDLTLFMTEAGDELLGTLEYNAQLFDAATVRRMRDHFQNLLRSIARSPSTPVGRLPLFGAAERHTMLEEWQGPRAPAPTEPVHEAFRRQARATPDAPALRFEGGSWSFARLDAESERLAGLLRAAGVGPESRVGIFLDRSPAMVAALWAVLRAGGAYVPLDPAAPPRRVEFVLEDAGIAAVLTSAALRPRLPESARVVEVDSDEVAPAAEPARVEMDGLAYVLYTSGSTGQPKGVEVTHRGLANYLLNWCLPAYAVADGEGAPVHSSLGFDLTVTGLLAPLLAGRPVTLVAEEREVEALAAELRAGADFSLVKLTPAHMEILNRLLDGTGAKGSARALVVGGEALPAPAVAAWLRRDPATRVFNEYGPTETVVGCCVHEATADDVEGGSIPIGRPITNARLYLLDGAMEPVPPGVAGEIYIGGMGVARGYGGRPALTAERFVPDPFGEPGARLYRSGDLGRHRADGTLLYLGRADDQLKLRGFRIEPGEIEAALGRHPGVAGAVVCPAANQQLAAYLIAATEPPPAASELQERLREWLPDYMVPAAVVFVDSFPLTSNGKVDRRALVESHHAAPSSTARYVAPRTPAEEILAALWAEVLGVERVGVEDDFFELGGHSMLALRVASRAREALGVEIALHSVFEARTVAALAAIAVRGTEAAAPLVKADRGAPLPLSFAQQRLWFLSRLSPGDPTYNIPYVLRLRGDLRVEVLGRALAEIVARHEVLRTRYPTVGGEPRQEIVEQAEPPLTVVDLRGENDPEGAAREAIQDEVRRPFDLAEGPLFRVRFFRVADGEHFGALVMHHIVSDAWSTELLVRELAALYAAFARDEPSPLEPLPFQYADFAAWQRRLLTPEAVAAHLEHWKARLGEHPAVLDLPTDRPRRVRSQAAGRRHAHVFPAALREGVMRVSREHGVTPFMTALAAFQLLLQRYSGQDDFVVGTPVAERGDRGLEGMIGLFLNMLPIRAELGGDPTLAEVLRRVRAVTLDAFAHQRLPFERLVEAFQGSRDLASRPLFQVLYTYQEAAPRAFELPDVEIRSLDISTGTARFDITLFVIDTGSALEARVEYDADLFDAATIERMTGHLEGVLEAITADAGRPAGAIPLLAPAETEQVVREWNRTATAFPLDECLHTLIARRAAEDPAAPAAEFPDATLTRGELERRASQLARYLRARGVGPDVPVAICVERSPEMLVGIMGILKAGGAYVPLDPTYPVERLAYMVHDSGAPLVLAQHRLLDRLPAGTETLSLDAEWAERVAPLDDGPLENVAHPESLAYVIYTSGSTGKPKGTMVSHRSVVNHGLSMVEVYGLGRDSRFSQFFSLSFDGSVEDLFPPLLAGGALLCHPNPTRHTLAEVFAFYREKGLTVLHLPTALWHLFAGELREGKVELPPTVRVTSAGGEALGMDRLRSYLANTGVPFINVYGPTEATVTASTLEAGPGRWDDFPGSSLPIGRPLPNVTLYVLDARMRPLPVGVPGELYIGGTGVARGYHARPSLTATRFVPDPFAGDGSRLYRTGDRVRYLADGTLEYLQRIDSQVKIRSFRVELAEIEAALAEHPGVREAVVDVREHGGDRRIVAYIVPAGEPPAPADLRRHLERFLPPYMIPAAMVTVAMVPLTPNGKVDRARLPDPDYAEQAARTFVAPRTPAEERVAAIWREILQLEQVGVEDNFFEVGGHSLLAVRVHERLQAEFSREIPLILLFEHTTVAALARVLGAEPAAAVALEGSDEWAGARRQALRRQGMARRARATEDE